MIHFLKYKWVYLGFSAIVIAVGLYSLFSAPLDYSIDFTGGSNIQYRYKGELSQDRLVKEFKDSKVKVLSITQTDAKTYTLKTSPVDEQTEAKIRENLSKDSVVQSIDQLRFETVGPSLGRETIEKTAIASAVAILGILLYVTFTFKKFSYGFSAILALVHDLLVLAGMYSILMRFTNAEVDALFITAVLTTMSFSVHDTIVVFDKIREYRRTSGLSMEVLANKALTETMVRSVNNSLTIVLMLVPLVILGTDTIRFFAAALLIGTISGTYSSPFVATPLLALFDRKR